MIRVRRAGQGVGSDGRGMCSIGDNAVGGTGGVRPSMVDDVQGEGGTGTAPAGRGCRGARAGCRGLLGLCRTGILIEETKSQHTRVAHSGGKAESGLPDGPV